MQNECEIIIYAYYTIIRENFLLMQNRRVCPMVYWQFILHREVMVAHQGDPVLGQRPVITRNNVFQRWNRLARDVIAMQ